MTMTTDELLQLVISHVAEHAPDATPHHREAAENVLAPFIADGRTTPADLQAICGTVQETLRPIIARKLEQLDELATMYLAAKSNEAFLKTLDEWGVDTTPWKG